MVKILLSALVKFMFVCALFVVLLLLAVSCGRQQEDPSSLIEPELPAVSEPDAPWDSALPAPDTLKSVLYTEAGIAYRGADFIAEFPHQHVVPVGLLGRYTPTWSGSGAGFGDLAFAIYEFDLEDYDRDESVRLTWAASADFDDAWLAVANFEENCWIWRDVPEPEEGDISIVEFDFDGCIEDETNRMLAMPAFMGTDTWDLDLIRVGEDPAAGILNVTPQQGYAGYQVTFAADLVGEEPFTYSWDFGGGAEPNTSVNEMPVVELGEGGSYSASLEVTNEFGSDLYEFTLAVSDSYEFYIMPDLDDPDWDFVTGSGTQEDPFKLDCQDYSRKYSLLANTEPDGSGDVLDIAELDWIAEPAFIVCWIGPGVFQGNMFTGGHLFAMSSPDSPSNQLFVVMPILPDSPPEAILEADPEIGFEPLIVELDASSSYPKSAPAIDKYEFDFDEGNGWEDNGGSATVMNIYENSGTYHPKLRVTDSNGYTDTDEAEIIVVAQLSCEYLEALPEVICPSVDTLQIFYPDPIVRRDPDIIFDHGSGTVQPKDEIAYFDVLKTNGYEFPIQLTPEGDVYPSIVIEETSDPEDITGPDDPDAISGLIMLERHPGRIAVDITVITFIGSPGDPDRIYSFKLFNSSEQTIGAGIFKVEPLDSLVPAPTGTGWGVNVWDREDKEIGDAIYDFTNHVVTCGAVGTATPEVLWFKFHGGWIYDWSQGATGITQSNDNVQVLVENTTNPTQVMCMSTALRIVGIGIDNEVIAVHTISDADFLDPLNPLSGILKAGQSYTVMLDDVRTPAYPDFEFTEAMIVVD